MKTQTFTVTERHLKLLRRFQVGWQDCEFGAPEIDPKRPYGNSDVLQDIHEILTGETGWQELTTEEIERYDKLHYETETALQIVLAVGQFKAGKYECDEYGTEWRECSNTKKCPECAGKKVVPCDAIIPGLWKDCPRCTQTPENDKVSDGCGPRARDEKGNS